MELDSVGQKKRLYTSKTIARDNMKALVEKLPKSKLSKKRTWHHSFVAKCHYLCSNALIKAVCERSKVNVIGYCACAYLHPRAGQKKWMFSNCLQIRALASAQRPPGLESEKDSRNCGKKHSQVKASKGRILYFTEYWQDGHQCQARPSLQV